jgi:hypothetical protein
MPKAAHIAKAPASDCRMHAPQRPTLAVKKALDLEIRSRISVSIHC